MILENLGWNIHRIWSTDWFKDSRREIEKVVERVRKIAAEERRVTSGRMVQAKPTAAAQPHDRGQPSLFGAADELSRSNDFAAAKHKKQ